VEVLPLDLGDGSPPCSTTAHTVPIVRSPAPFFSSPIVLNVGEDWRRRGGEEEEGFSSTVVVPSESSSLRTAWEGMESRAGRVRTGVLFPIVGRIRGQWFYAGLTRQSKTEGEREREEDASQPSNNPKGSTRTVGADSK